MDDRGIKFVLNMEILRRLVLMEQSPPNENSLSWSKVSPWAVMGALVVLVAITGVFTLTTIRHLNAHTTALLKEKGAALIRSFEAGARTGMKGMMGMKRGRFKIQRLLTETAQQNDIVYLIVTDPKGTVLAHSDPKQIDQFYGANVDWEMTAKAEQIFWRTRKTEANAPVFEVYRRFAPIKPAKHHWHPPDNNGNRDIRKNAHRGDGKYPPPPSIVNLPSPGAGVIFVGLDMASASAARRTGVRQALLTGGLVLVLGLGAVGVFLLIQANRATRSSLSRVQAFSDHVVKHLPVGLVALNGRNRVVAYNRTAQRYIGKDPSMVMDQSARSLFGDGFNAILNHDAPKREEIQFESPLGTKLTLAVSTSLLPATQNGVQGRLILLEDLTRVKRLQGEVQKQERLAAVGRLAAGVAHEIRNPLSSIKGFALYFKERYPDVTRDRETADIMIEEVDRLNRVIGQLLDLARPEMLDIKAVAPGPLVRDSLRMITEQARRQAVQTDLIAKDDLPLVAVDPDKIKQVLLNLLLNALEAMSHGGGALRITLGGDRDNDSVTVAIHDTGCGIDGSQLSRIHDPYYTTKPGGTGLGLAIVHKILEAHSARMEVSSKPGEGTDVRIYLPLSAEEESP
jgi:two-component system sensor histidine kinase HydH